MTRSLRCPARLLATALLVLVATLLPGQNNISFDFVEGDFFLCAEDSLVRIEIKPNPDRQFESIQLSWDGNSGDIVNITDPGKLVQQHRYPTSSLLRMCDLPVTCFDPGLCYNIKLRALYTDSPEPENINRDIIFRKRPDPEIDGAETTYCIGQEAILRSGTCPGNDPSMVYEWTLPDGTVVSGSDVRYTFTQLGEFNFRLKATNDCGSVTTNQKIRVVDSPVAVAVPDSNLVEGYTEPYRVCLYGSARIRLNATGTKSTTHTSWSVFPATGITFDDPGKSIARARFTVPGTYTFTLLAENRNCGEFDQESFVVEVIESSDLRLEPEPDACPSLTYTPRPSVDPDATYYIDGQAVASFPVNLSGRAEPYIIRAEKKTLCGNLVERDTFFVDVPVEARLLSPDNGADYCPDTSRVELEVSASGGTWVPARGLVLENGRAYFDRAAGPGAYRFDYVTGSGACERTLTVNLSINAQVIELPGEDVLVCEGGERVTLNVSPAGGNLTGTGVVPGSYVFDPAGQPPGSYTLTYTYQNPETQCRETGAFSVAVVAEPTGEAGPAIELCNADQSVRLADFLPGQTATPADAVITYAGRGVTNPTGSYNPGLLAVGDLDTVTVRYADPRLPGSCYAEDFLLVAIVSVAVAEAGPDTVLCSGTGPFQLGTGGGSWTGPGASPDGTVDLSTLAPDTYTYTLTVGNGICQTTDTRRVTVAPGNGVRLATDRLFLCDTAATIKLPAATPATGGSWSGPLEVVEGVARVAGAAPDTYTMTYRVASLPEGCNAAEATVNILPRPRVELAGDSLACAGGDCATLTLSAGDADRYHWYGTGGVEGSGDTLCHAFASAGRYTVNLLGYRTHPETGADLCASPVRSREVSVFEAPLPARIQASTRSLCPGEVVTLSAADPGSNLQQPLSYRWEVGNATYRGATLRDLSLPAPVEDTLYRITLHTEGYCGTATDTLLLEVRAAPRAAIGVVYAQPCSGAELRLANVSTGTLDELLWTSSDGDRFTTFDPPVLQPLTGTLPRQITYSLRVANRCGIDTTSTVVTVNPTDVKARIAYRDTVVCVGEAFEAVNISTPSALVTYEFADGNRFAGDTLRRTFAEPGSYPFTVYAFGCGYDSSEWRVRVRPLPEAALEVPAIVCPDEVFDYRLTGSGVGYRLDFGDGTVTETNVGSHRYPLADTTLSIGYRVTDLEGCTTVGNAIVEVATRPAVTISAVDSLCAGQPVAFGSAGSETCRWDFGDGEITDDCSPEYVFPASGTQYVTLIGATDRGCTDTATLAVFVRPTPRAELLADYPRDQCGPTSVRFAFGDPGGPVSSYQLWPGDGGGPLTERDPVYTYGSGGSFTARLRVGFDGVCFDTASTTVKLAEFPVARLEVSDTRCFPDEYAALEVLTDNADDNIALFGDGIFLDGRNRFELDRPGDYEIEVVSPDGCDTTLTYRLDSVIPLTLETIADTIVEYGDSVRLFTQTNTAGLRFTWTWPEYLSGDTLAEPWARPLDDTEFTVTAYDSLCSVRDSVRVGVQRPASLVYVPTAFSPNGDGNNDRLAVFPRVGVAEVLRFDVYNRWGVRVHRQTDGFGIAGSELNWDGRHRGAPLTSAVYVYALTYRDVSGRTGQQSGELLLLR
ncbi:PKD domain-containing protein [Lewinella sp. IMCC34183]|uniref:PKD domain-containing protein n=1 Tax=Lewinella sp. IMCC34183 TaxID=2248762 RepID=UPI0018E56487|nr:PKD domain-containing protein [Lewinella sp. IMCC34183]